MKYDSAIHHRRSIRWQGYDYSLGGAYFLTFCTHEREAFLGEVVDGEVHLSPLGENVLEIWLALPGHFANVELGEFAIMPNHVHGIVFVTESVGAVHEPPLHSADTVGAIHELPLRQQRRQMLIPKIIGYFKMNSAKQINVVRDTPGTPVWQRDYYDRVIRNESEYDAIRQYIADNAHNWEQDKEYRDARKRSCTRRAGS